ncbi:MAG: helix-turn-helix domain-containing protein [Euryarchaeota archaeon]|nr:helix-turn-helix domain-containing protein [Euryarchaeota archaeon]
MADSVVLLEPGDDRAKKIGRAMANRTAGDVLDLLKGEEHTLSEISDTLGLPMTSVKYHVENLIDAGMIEIVREKYSEKGREVKVYGVCNQIIIMSPGTKDIKSLLLKYISLFGIILLATVMISTMSPVLMQGISQTGGGELVAYSGVPDVGVTPVSNGAGIPDMTAAHVAPTAPTVGGTVPVTETSSPVTGPLPALPSAGDNIIVPETGLMKGADESELQPQSQLRLPAATPSEGYGESGALESPVHGFVVAFFSGGCLVLLLMMIYEFILFYREKQI